MASLTLRNARNLQSAQRAWDDMEPPIDPIPWIETVQGQGWLNRSITSLIQGSDVVISFSEKVTVTAAEFICAFGEQAVDIYAYDPKNSLEWALARGVPFYGPEWQRLAKEVAESLLLKHKDAAEKSHAWLRDE